MTSELMDDDIIRLDSSDRKVRIEALERLWDQANCPQMRRYVTRISALASDSSERCREACLRVIAKVVAFCENVAEISCVVPTVVQRLAKDVEPSEDVRHALVELLQDIAEKSNGLGLEDHMESVIEALGVTLLDQYLLVRKLSCNCVSWLASARGGHFYQYSEALVTPLLTCLIQPSSTTLRLLSLRALGEIMLEGSSKNFIRVWQHVAQHLMDPSPVVCEEVIKISGKWILHMPNRQCYYPQLVSLILTGLSNNSDKIQDIATKVWHDAGELYETENKNDLREKIEYELPVSIEYPGERPRSPLGCRILVQRSLTFLLPAVFNDLKDLDYGVRLQSVYLLYRVLLHAEAEMTQFTPIIIDGMLCGCKEDELYVTQKILVSASLVGYFVPAKIWLSIILEKLENDPSTLKLSMLAAMMGNCSDSDLRICATSLVTALLDAATYHTQSIPYQEQIFICVKIMMRSRECAQDVLFPIFQLLVMTYAYVDSIRIQVSAWLDRMLMFLNLTKKDQLFDLYTKDVLTYLVRSQPCTSWNVRSWQFLVFRTFLMQTGHLTSDSLTAILPIMVDLTKPDQDAKRKFHSFKIMSHLSVVSDETEFEDFALVFIRDCVLPNLDWRAGKSASIVRAAALACCYCLLQRIGSGKEEFATTVFNLVLSKTSSCLTDDNHTAREKACEIFNHLMLNHATLCKSDDFHVSSTKLVARLDDTQLPIRVKACQALGPCLKAWMTAPKYDERVHGIHLGIICDGLIVYLDDPQVEFQMAVLKMLKIVFRNEPEVVYERVVEARQRQKNQHHLDELSLCFESVKMS